MKGMPKPKLMKAEEELHLREGDFVLTEGVWENKARWKFVVSPDRPDPNLCTAAFCVTTYQGLLVLVNNRHRGWEIPGGHIDEGEDLSQALVREVLEEGGVVIENPKMFGYKLILPSTPINHRDREGKIYPFPRSYIPFYYAEAVDVLKTRLEEDVVGVKLVGFNEAKRMLSPEPNNDKVIEYLISSKLITVSE